MYQKCHGWVEGALRLIQAWLVGGIIAHLAEDAWAAESLITWLSALQPSAVPPLHSSPGLLPFQAGLAPARGDSGCSDYKLAWEPTRWTLLDVSKRLHAQRSPQMYPLAPRPSRTPNQSPILSPSISRYPPRAPSAWWCAPRSPSPYPLVLSPPRRQTPALSAVGGYNPDLWECLPTVPGSPPLHPTPSPPSRSRTEHHYSLRRGNAPWLYYTE